MSHNVVPLTSQDGGDLPERLARAEAAMEGGDPAAARRECIAVLAAAARAGDRLSAIRALELLTHQCWWLGDMAACIDYGLRAIDRCKAEGDWARCITSLVLVAYALCELELGERALRFAREAHRLAERDELAERRSTTLAALAHVHGKLGHLDEAEQLVLEALSMARESADPLDEPRIKINHASTLVDVYRHHEPKGDEELLHAVRERIKRQVIQMRPLIARSDRLPAHYQQSVLIAAGTACIYAGELERARELLTRALQALDDNTNNQMHYHALLGLADLELRSGQPQRCVEVLERIMQGPSVLPQTQMLHEYHDLAARARRQLGHATQADEHGIAQAQLAEQRAAAQATVEQRLSRWAWPFGPRG